MPMIRDTPPPLPADVLRDLLAALAPTYGHRLVDHEGKLVLAIRVPHEAPDRERDLRLAADVVGEDEVSLARDVLLIGDEKLIRLDPIPLRDAVRERVRDDTPVSKEVRRGVERAHGAVLFQPATRRDTCVAVRVPRASYRDTTPEDLVALQAALQPVLAQPQAQRASLCYLVADNDYRRCTPEEFARVLRGEVPLKPPKVNTYAVAGDGRPARAMASASGASGSPFGMLVGAAMTTDATMEKNKQRKAAPAPPAPPTTAPPASPMASLLAPAPAPLVQLAPPAPAAPLPPVGDPVTALGTQLASQGFEVLTDVGDLGIQLAAHQPGGKRLIAQRAPEATPEAVQSLVKLCGELEADVGVLVADHLPVAGMLEAAGTKVVVLPANLAAL